MYHEIILNSLWLFNFFPGTALSIISCIFSVASSQNQTFLSTTLSFLRNSIHFHIRSNPGIMAGNQDPVSQSESYNCIIQRWEFNNIVYTWSVQSLPQCYSFLSQAFFVFHHRFSLTPPKKEVNVGTILLNYEHSYQGCALEEPSGPSWLTFNSRRPENIVFAPNLQTSYPISK